MQPRWFYLLIISIFAALTLCAPKVARALERWLVPDTSQCASDTTVNPCHTLLSDAVNSALAGDTIKIFPGTYAANVTINKNITIYGTETARTFLTGNGSPAVTVSGVVAPAMEIRNLTFTNASPGILVQNASSFNIRNNIFEVGNSTTAIQVADTSSPSIVNNTFYQNGTAVLSAPSTLSIINNIFSGNTLAISANVAIDNILNNLFWQNTAIGPTTISFNSGVAGYKGNVNAQDPLFVHPSDSVITKRDFHVTSKTPGGNTSAGANSIDSISPPDMGAYGGSSSDTIPFPVQNLVSSATSTTTVHLTWDANLSYQVTGYAVYYGTVSSSLTTTATPDPGNVTAYDVTSLSTATAPTGTPVLGNSIANQTLLLDWNAGAVSNATGYEVRYDTDSAPTSATCPFVTTPTSSSPTIDVGNVMGYNLSGLTNQICYSILVIPYAQNIYYFTVRAHYANTAFASANSNVVSQAIGGKTYGTASNVIHDFPESITAYPDLPKKSGCFIATAAYGYYSAPQVMALREFRDQYLLTNALGRAFVRWYYAYGPIGAEYMNSHPWLKPVVRAALMPAIGGALFMTKTSAITKTFVTAVFAGLLILCMALKARKGEQP